MFSVFVSGCQLAGGQVLCFEFSFLSGRQLAGGQVLCFQLFSFWQPACWWRGVAF